MNAQIVTNPEDRATIAEIVVQVVESTTLFQTLTKPHLTKSGDRG
jgi:hypothetical protein